MIDPRGRFSVLLRVFFFLVADNHSFQATQGKADPQRSLIK